VVITFEPTLMEVWRRRKGKPIGRAVWTPAVYVVVDGRKCYPPMQKREAKRFAEGLKATVDPASGASVL